MATNRCLNKLTRHCPYLFSSSSSSSKAPIQTIITKSPLHTLSAAIDSNLSSPGNPSNTSNPPHLHHKFGSLCYINSNRHFSSQRRYPNGKQDDTEEEEGEDAEGEDDDDDDEEGELSENRDEEENQNDVFVSNRVINRTYSLEEKEQEADAIGYKVMGPLDPSERPFKHREPFFAVVQIGSHQFKVSNGDAIYTERLKFCEVNDKLILSKVLMVGSQNQTIIGRPILPNTAVHAVVEEHALDAKVIIFKKKRRKNYRRTKGHRQELTRLRITDIQGIEKPVKPEKPEKPGKREREKLEREKLEREAVAA